jgi:hypothetical protein
MPHIKNPFPYGISNWESLATEDYVFVDKTPYIVQLENFVKFAVFLRPRRFGKSLFASLLKYYYDIRQQHKFQNIFRKYFIGKHPTPLANQYRFLKFDFSGIDTTTNERSYEGFLVNLKTTLTTFLILNEFDKPDLKEEIHAQSTPAQVMKAFFELGNLTIKESNEINVPVFKIPNLVIEELYWEYYADVLQNRTALPYEEDKVRPAVLDLARGNDKPFFTLIERNLRNPFQQRFQKF